MKGTPYQILLVGNFTLDVKEGGNVPGGSVFYSGCAAQALGFDVRIVSAVGPGFPLDEALKQLSCEVSLVEAGETTTFRNVYRGSAREQFLCADGGAIPKDALPAGWGNEDIVLLCPVYSELRSGLEASVRGRLTGASLQGWLRTTRDGGRVVPRVDSEFLAGLDGVDVLFYSEEDVAHHPELGVQFRSAADVVVETRGPGGAAVWLRGSQTHVPGYPVKELDPTGAGDTFAAAFLVHYSVQRDALAAADFACRICSVQVGLCGPLTRDALVGNPVFEEWISQVKARR